MLCGVMGKWIMLDMILSEASQGVKHTLLDVYIYIPLKMNHCPLQYERNPM